MTMKVDVMTERRADRIIEMYRNAMRNGEQWAHDVFLHRGTAKYEKNLCTLNEAFEVKAIETVVRPLKSPSASASNFQAKIRNKKR